jgi:hypothetical protein
MAISLERLIRITGLLACGTIAALILIFAFTGAGQDSLQVVQPSSQYAAHLLAHPVAMRAVLLIDKWFILFYVTLFLSLGVVMRRLGSPAVLVIGAIGLMCLTGALDLVENQHFLTMMVGAEQGCPPGAREIALQVLESLTKFHVSYVGLFLLAFGLPKRTKIQRVYAGVLAGVQLPASLLVAVTAPPIATVFVLTRSFCFVFGLLVIALSFGSLSRRRRPGPVSSLAPLGAL